MCELSFSFKKTLELQFAFLKIKYVYNSNLF